LRELQNCWWGGNVAKRDEGKWVPYLSTEIGSGKGKKLFSTMLIIWRESDRWMTSLPYTLLLQASYSSPWSSYNPLWYSYSS
jgi:hypothetical protein